MSKESPQGKKDPHSHNRYDLCLLCLYHRGRTGCSPIGISNANEIRLGKVALVKERLRLA